MVKGRDGYGHQNKKNARDDIGFGSQELPESYNDYPNPYENDVYDEDNVNDEKRRANQEAIAHYCQDVSKKTVKNICDYIIKNDNKRMDEMRAQFGGGQRAEETEEVIEPPSEEFITFLQKIIQECEATLKLINATRKLPDKDKNQGNTLLKNYKHMVHSMLEKRSWYFKDGKDIGWVFQHMLGNIQELYSILTIMNKKGGCFSCCGNKEIVTYRVITTKLDNQFLVYDKFINADPRTITVIKKYEHSQMPKIPQLKTDEEKLTSGTRKILEKQFPNMHEIT